LPPKKPASYISLQMDFWWPPLRFSCQSSWLQIQRSELVSRRYQIFWEVVGLERGTLSLVSKIEKLLLERKSSDSGPEIRDYGRRDPSRWPRGTLYPQRLALTSPTSDGRYVGIVRSRTQATEFFFWLVMALDGLIQNNLQQLHLYVGYTTLAVDATSLNT
jgi:hypothetical protein